MFVYVRQGQTPDVWARTQYRVRVCHPGLQSKRRVSTVKQDHHRKRLFVKLLNIQCKVNNFLAPLAIRQQAYVMARCLSCVHVCVNFYINPSPNQALVFRCLQYRSSEPEGKGEIAHNEQLFLYPQFLVPVWRTFSQVSLNLKMLSCYGRPLLQAWLFPDLNTISKNCVREKSL